MVSLNLAWCCTVCVAGVFYWRRWQIVGGSSAVGLHGLLETPWLSFVAWLALLGRYTFFLVFVRLLFVLFVILSLVAVGVFGP